MSIENIKQKLPDLFKAIQKQFEKFMEKEKSIPALKKGKNLAKDSATYVPKEKQKPVQPIATSPKVLNTTTPIKPIIRPQPLN